MNAFPVGDLVSMIAWIIPTLVITIYFTSSWDGVIMSLFMQLTSKVIQK